MDKFRNKVKTRSVLLSLGLIAIIAIYIILKNISDNVLEVSDFFKGFQSGAFMGIGVLLIFVLINYITALLNEKHLRKLYIKETDEREILIRQKSGSAELPIFAYSLFIAIIVSGFYNEIIFYTLIGISFYLGITKLFLLIYYNYKY